MAVTVIINDQCELSLRQRAKITSLVLEYDKYSAIIGVLPFEDTRFQSWNPTIKIGIVWDKKRTTEYEVDDNGSCFINGPIPRNRRYF